MFADNLELFQYYKGFGFGAVFGLTVAWLAWRLPVHLRTRMTRKLRKQVLDLKRIEAAFTGKEYAPNPRELRVVRVPLRDRMMEAWQVWLAAWRADIDPKTPERVAEEAYRRAVAEAM